MTYNHYEQWKNHVEFMEWSIESGGDGRLYAVDSEGDKRGSWNPNYGGCGFGWIY